MNPNDLTEQGVKDGLAALADLSRSLNASERRAEQRLSEAEAELITARKIRGYIEGDLAAFRARLRAIEDAKR